MGDPKIDVPAGDGVPVEKGVPPGSATATVATREGMAVEVDGGEAVAVGCGDGVAVGVGDGNGVKVEVGGDDAVTVGRRWRLRGSGRGRRRWRSCVYRGSSWQDRGGYRRGGSLRKGRCDQRAMVLPRLRSQQAWR